MACTPWPGAVAGGGGRPGRTAVAEAEMSELHDLLRIVIEHVPWPEENHLRDALVKLDAVEGAAAEDDGQASTAAQHAAAAQESMHAAARFAAEAKTAAQAAAAATYEPTPEPPSEPLAKDPS